MPDPNIALVLKKLLSLDTPVSKRIFDIALLLALVVAASYIRDHFKDRAGMVEFATMAISVFGGLALFFMVFGLIRTAVTSAMKDVQSEDKK